MRKINLKAVKLQSGLIVPEHSLKKKEPKKEIKYGPLEIEDIETRKEVSDILTKWRNHSYICGSGGGIVFPGVQTKRELRIDLIMLLGHALLGSDWNPEVKC